MTKLSVNVNKIATLRNARGGNLPDVIKAAKDCLRFGADGITVHPRPDERHIRYNDVFELKKFVQDFNIEGYPSEKFLEMVMTVVPNQCTLVPDPPDVLTSDTGWNIQENWDFLDKTIRLLKSKNIRTSLFVDPDPAVIKDASSVGVDRIELYTGSYAENFHENKAKAIEKFVGAADVASSLGLGINCGHDLNLDNLDYLIFRIPKVLEVSIGHALICDALYLGLEKTIAAYKEKLNSHTHNQALFEY